MVHKTVYLAGPISGLSYDEAMGWREIVTAELAKSDIRGLSPLRAKVYLRECNSIADHYVEGDIDTDACITMSNPRGITTRDRFDCTKCSVLFVNLLATTKVSIGTVMEIAWADVNRIPIVIVMEKTGNLHDHAMINECVGFKVSTVSEGVDIVKAILAEY